jgi:hypothetical protein
MAINHGVEGNPDLYLSIEPGENNQLKLSPLPSEFKAVRLWSKSTIRNHICILYYTTNSNHNLMYTLQLKLK